MLQDKDNGLGILKKIHSLGFFFVLFLNTSIHLTRFFPRFFTTRRAVMVGIQHSDYPCTQRT